VKERLKKVLQETGSPISSIFKDFSGPRQALSSVDLVAESMDSKSLTRRPESRNPPKMGKAKTLETAIPSVTIDS
jgi:hypothetical protein